MSRSARSSTIKPSTSDPAASQLWLGSAGPLMFTFSTNDVFNSSLIDSNDGVHYVVRTPADKTSAGVALGRGVTPSKTSSPKLAPFAPPNSTSNDVAQGLAGRQRSRAASILRNPTIIVRPKSASCEAKIVASLQWHHWSDSMMLSRRGSITKLDKVFVESSASYPHNGVDDIEDEDGLW